MRKSYLLTLLLAGVAVLTWTLSGCGDAKRNDQGVSFSFLGWAAYDPDSPQAEPPPISAIKVPLSDPNPEGYGTWGAVVEDVHLQNNLSGQTIRAETIYFSYYIPGARVQPPDTTAGLATVLGPAGGNTPCPFGKDECPSTLPGNLDQVGDEAFIPVPIVTDDIRTFMNMNRQYLPEPPFVMEVMAYVSGVASSGYRLNTNQMQIMIYFTPDDIIPPPTPSAASSSSAAAQGE